MKELRSYLQLLGIDVFIGGGETILERPKIMRHSIRTTCALVVVTLAITNGIGGQSLGKDSVTGEWEGTFTPSSRLGTLRAKVDLTKEGGPGTQGEASSAAEATVAAG